MRCTLSTWPETWDVSPNFPRLTLEAKTEVSAEEKHPLLKTRVLSEHDHMIQDIHHKSRIGEHSGTSRECMMLNRQNKELVAEYPVRSRIVCHESARKL